MLAPPLPNKKRERYSQSSFSFDIFFLRAVLSDNCIDKNISSPSWTPYNATKICNLHLLTKRQASPLPVGMFTFLFCFFVFFFCPFVLVDYKKEFAKKTKQNKNKNKQKNATDQKRTVGEYNYFSYDHIEALTTVNYSLMSKSRYLR